MTWVEQVASVATTTQQEAVSSKGLLLEDIVEMAWPEKADVLTYEMTEEEASIFLDTALVHSGIW